MYGIHPPRKTFLWIGLTDGRSLRLHHYIAVQCQETKEMLLRELVMMIMRRRMVIMMMREMSLPVALASAE